MSFHVQAPLGLYPGYSVICIQFFGIAPAADITSWFPVRRPNKTRTALYGRTRQTSTSGRRKIDISMGNAQEGVWLLVISLSYPRQTLSNICVQRPSRARDACAKPPVARRDFPPFLRAPLTAFSSKDLFHLVPNDWR